jgi:PPM family protein phosphatase
LYLANTIPLLVYFTDYNVKAAFIINSLFEMSRMDGHDTNTWKAFHNREVSGNGWSAYGESRTGRKRVFNEDNYTLLPLAQDHLLVAVADGLGGHSAGQLASRLACETLCACAYRDLVERVEDRGYSIAQSLEAMVIAAHRTIVARSHTNAIFAGMGCTLTAAVVSASRAWYCHVGDSRLYHIGKSSFQQVTYNHSVKNSLSSTGNSRLLEDLERDGEQLEQALGHEEAHNQLKTQQGTIVLRDGDSLLVCSDGLYGKVAEQRLADIVRDDSSIVTGVQKLIAASVQAGSSDDITAVLVNVATDSIIHKRRPDSS